MAFDAEGFDQLKLILKRAADLPSEMNGELKVMAKKTQELAIHMAPIEYGDLKDAIKIQEVAGQGAGGRFAKGLRNFVVYVDNNHPVSDERQIRNNIETVGEYAWFVHEYMGWGSHSGAPLEDGRSFMPSEKSVAEGERYGVEAGGRFLERAGDEIADRIDAELGKVVFKWIEALDIE